MLEGFNMCVPTKCTNTADDKVLENFILKNKVFDTCFGTASLIQNEFKSAFDDKIVSIEMKQSKVSLSCPSAREAASPAPASTASLLSAFAVLLALVRQFLN